MSGAPAMVVVLDCGSGNVGAVENMIRKVGGAVRLEASPERIDDAEKLVLPGVGAFDEAVRRLHDGGWWERIRSFAASGRPLLGICLGMQLLTRASEEGALPGLDLVPAKTRRLRPDPATRLRIPHMGWNEVRPVRDSPLLSGLDEGSRFYFAHSYHVVCDDPADVSAVAEYGEHVTACVQRGNIFATQFHPEKSHRFGMQLFRNFVHRI